MYQEEDEIDESRGFEEVMEDEGEIYEEDDEYETRDYYGGEQYDCSENELIPLNATEKAIQEALKKQKEDEDRKIRQYELKRAQEREQLERELEELKLKRELRRQERQAEERERAEMLRVAEERRRTEEEEKRHREEEAKKKKEEERRRKLALMAGGMVMIQPMGKTGENEGKRNFVINKKKSDAGQEDIDNQEKIKAHRMDYIMNPEQMQMAKQHYMQQFRKPCEVDVYDISSVRSKIKDLHKRVCKLEAQHYDLEERQRTQDYDLKELNERQRQIWRNEARRKGLDPEEYANAKHPPLVSVLSRFERQVDRRSYTDRRTMFDKSRKGNEPKELYHGSCRPPDDWMPTARSEELQQIRKFMQHNKPTWIEQDPIPDAKPPMDPIPAQDVPIENGWGHSDDVYECQNDATWN